MKILNAMFSKVNGGLEQVFLNYIPALTSQGNQVISVIHPQAQILPQCPQENLVLIHNYNKYDPLAIYKLHKLLQSEKPDCIITHSYRAAYLFNKTRTKIPRIAVCHVKGHYNFGSNAIIALTETMRQEIISTGISAQNVFAVPNMISIPPNTKYRPPRDSIVPIIGVCARLAAIKGVDVFIKALAELKQRGISFLAQIAGDGPEKENYIKLIRQYHLEDVISLLGWIDNRPAFYSNIDIFCLPSREEAFGLVILEAMLHSLPCVLSELSGPIDIVGNTNCALFATPEDPISIANGLEQLIQDKRLANTYAIRAFDRAQHFSEPNIAPQLHQVIKTVCARNII